MEALPWHESIFRHLLERAASLPHALLLHGREGTGKLQFALAIAQSLVCENVTATGACGACPACAWFAASSHPDVRRIEPGGGSSTESGEEGEPNDNAQITVEQIRELADFLGLSSHRGGRKVIVLHPAEKLNISAANALLKSLEEPAPQTVFLLVSHRPHNLLPTIKSRCQLVALRGPTRDVAAAWLESQGVADAGLAAAHTGESPLIAVQLTAEDYWQPRADFLRRLNDGAFDPISAAEQLQGYSVPYVLSWLQKWSYDLASQKVLGRVRYNPDHERALATLTCRLDALAILRFHREMVRLQRFVHHPLNPRLFIESILFSYSDLVRSATRI